MSAQRYRTLVADPPWRYTKQPTELRSGGRGASAEHHYCTATTDELALIDVAGLAADDAHLYCWVTNPILTRQRQAISGSLDAIDLVRAWGFAPRALLTWVKTGPPGMGFYFRGNTEHIIFATRGQAGIEAASRVRNYFEAPRGAHSAKPDAFLDMVERISPGPYLELFARRARFGWDYWGNESLGTAAMAGEL